MSEYLRPGRDLHKLFSYLYPSEVLALLKCGPVPVGRRVLYALAVYTGLRKGSLYALTWAGVDFEHGTLTSLHSKTGLPQLFEVPPDLETAKVTRHTADGDAANVQPLRFHDLRATFVA